MLDKYDPYLSLVVQNRGRSCKEPKPNAVTLVLPFHPIWLHGGLLGAMYNQKHRSAGAACRHPCLNELRERTAAHSRSLNHALATTKNTPVSSCIYVFARTYLQYIFMEDFCKVESGAPLPQLLPIAVFCFLL